MLRQPRARIDVQRLVCIQCITQRGFHRAMPSVMISFFGKLRRRPREQPVGARSVDLDNRFDIDGYTTFDATAAYAFSPRLELSLRLANLTDRFHVEGVQASNNLYPGSPRAFSLQVRMQL